MVRALTGQGVPNGRCVLPELRHVRHDDHHHKAANTDTDEATDVPADVNSDARADIDADTHTLACAHNQSDTDTDADANPCADARCRAGVLGCT